MSPFPMGSFITDKALDEMHFTGGIFHLFLILRKCHPRIQAAPKHGKFNNWRSGVYLNKYSTSKLTFVPNES